MHSFILFAQTFAFDNIAPFLLLSYMSDLQKFFVILEDFYNHFISKQF